MYKYIMRNSIKTWIISATFATMPMNVSASVFEKDQNDLKNETNIELLTVLNDSDSIESINLYIPSKLVVKAILDYFDEEVEIYKLSLEAKQQIRLILNSYFSSHNVFDIDINWNMKFVMDDKKEFALMAKKVLNVVIENMPFLVRKVIIPLFLWWNDEIQKKLDNLDATMMNMNEKQYKSMVLDYIAWIARRVVVDVDWKFTVWEYYWDISSYYPNKNWKRILEELKNSNQINLDIRNYKYKK